MNEDELPKSFTERFFHTSKGGCRLPLPDELKFLKLFDGAAEHLWKLLAELAGATEKRVVDFDLWALMDGSAKCLKEAREHAKKRVEFLENKLDEDELRTWAAGSRKSLALWFKENE
jgi:hypothetical protein